jgi:lipid-A-disaccharide synthase
MPEARDWIETGSVYDLMQRAEVGVVASGTATLEAACFGLPYLLVYKVNPVTYVVGKAVVRIKHLGIVNILAGETVVKEMIQDDYTPEKLAEELLRLLRDEPARDALSARLTQIVATLGHGGAYGRAAAAVASQLNASEIAEVKA